MALILKLRVYDAKCFLQNNKNQLTFETKQVLKKNLIQPYGIKNFQWQFSRNKK